MYINARERVGPWMDVLVKNAETGETIKFCIAANTDEGWFEELVTDPLTQKPILEGEQFKSVRVTDRPFYIVNKATGQKLE